MSDFSPVANAPSLFVNGFQYAVTGNTTITVTAGSCRSFDNSEDIIVTAPLTTINATHRGLNGLDSGSLAANSVYALYVLSDTANLVAPGFILSLSQVNLPFLPPIFNTMRRIAWFSTDSDSHFRPINVCGLGNVRTVDFQTPVSVLSAGTATSLTEVVLSTALPNIQMPVIFQAGFTNAGYDATMGAGNTASFNSFGTGTPSLTLTSNTPYLATYQFEMVNGVDSTPAPSIWYEVAVVTDGTPSLDLAINGYVDYL
jgi:hypothetical protein